MIIHNPPKICLEYPREWKPEPAPLPFHGSPGDVTEVYLNCWLASTLEGTATLLYPKETKLYRNPEEVRVQAKSKTGTIMICTFHVERWIVEFTNGRRAERRILIDPYDPRNPRRSHSGVSALR